MYSEHGWLVVGAGISRGVSGAQTHDHDNDDGNNDDHDNYDNNNHDHDVGAGISRGVSRAQTPRNS